MPRARVLFVDDEDSIRTTFGLILQEHDFEICLASTVSDAIREVHSTKFDVLISDLNVGAHGDGFDVIDVMGKEQPDCVKIILTGYPALDSTLRAFSVEVDDYLVKPTDIEALIEKINRRLAAKTVGNKIEKGTSTTTGKE